MSSIGSVIDNILEKNFPSLIRSSRTQIADLCGEIRVPAGTVFIEKGKRDIYEYMVEEGVARSFLPDREGTLITLMFFEVQDIVSPHVTRTHHGKSLINFEAITHCKFIRFDAQEFKHLIEQDPEIRDFANAVLRQELFKKIDKEIRLISWTARQRLDQFRRDFHMLENIVPHNMIATYLGITNVSLSRLRNRK